MSSPSLRRHIVAALLVASSSVALAAPPQHFHPKVAREAYNADPASPVHVIITYNSEPGTDKDANVVRGGGTAKNHLHSIHGLSAEVTPTDLDRLASDPDVAHISIDHPLKSRQMSAITAPDYTTEPINAAYVWAQNYIGTNIGVAVIDSGITPVADLSLLPKSPLSGNQPAPLKFPPLPPLAPTPPAPGAPAVPGTSLVSAIMGQIPNTRIVYSQNFVPGQNDAFDHFGHGTHVAGLIAGNGTASTGGPYWRTFFGAAPNANIINLRVLDQNGAGTDSSVIAAIEQAIALKSTYNIRIINLSIGRPIFESYTVDPLCQAVEQAWKAGIIVVVAAGNDGRDLNLNGEGYGTINAPGNDPYVITVGAMNTNHSVGLNDDIIASYSSKGPSFIDDVVKPDIVAPGNLVISLQYPSDSLAVNNPLFVTPMSFYKNGNNQNASTDYFPLSGTSMATGVTSGAIASLLQAVPLMTPDQVKALLMVHSDRSYFPSTSSVTDSGVTYNANYDVFTIGAGFLDMNAALQKCVECTLQHADRYSDVADCNVRSSKRKHDTGDRSNGFMGTHECLQRIGSLRKQCFHSFRQWIYGAVGPYSSLGKERPGGLYVLVRQHGPLGARHTGCGNSSLGT